MRARHCLLPVLVVGAVTMTSCSEALVMAPRPTGRSWLVGNSAEPHGFGLYSYLLFGSRPSDATRPLYLAVVKASLDKVGAMEGKLQAGFSPGQLNLYSILVDAGPPSNMNHDDLAGWVVDHYNFDRAERMLGVVSDKQRGNGVYILSVLSKPLDVSRPLAPPYLWQDLTHVEPTIVVAWIQFFLDQSAKEKPWDENRGEKLALDLRNAIEQAANAAKVTIPAMATAIRWFKPSS